MDSTFVSMLDAIKDFGLFKLDGTISVSCENISHAITFISLWRLLFFSIYYNPKTGLIITVITLISAWFWLDHIYYIHKIYKPLLKDVLALRHLFIFFKIRIRLSKRMPVDYTLIGSLKQFRNALAGLTPHYRTDIFGLILSITPHFLRSLIEGFYYDLYERIFPAILKLIKLLLNMSVFVIVYNIFARVGKRYLPYHIRWHWTFICILLPIEQVYTFFVLRLNTFAMNEGLLVYNYKLFFKFQCIIGVLILLHFLFLFYALLHAVLGQYFYIPGLTYQVDTFVGPRPRNSLYSCGYTTWQRCNPLLTDNVPDGLKALKNKKRIWWGWFGRNHETEIEEIRIILKSKFVKKIERFFKRIFK